MRESRRKRDGSKIKEEKILLFVFLLYLEQHSGSTENVHVNACVHLCMPCICVCVSVCSGELKTEGSSGGVDCGD